MYFTYILFSEKLNKYYIGYTQNLDNRVEDHNNSRSKFTKLGKPWTLVWHKAFTTQKEALSEEKRIKNKKSRKYIVSIVTSSSN